MLWRRRWSGKIRGAQISRGAEGVALMDGRQRTFQSTYSSTICVITRRHSTSPAEAEPPDSTLARSQSQRKEIVKRNHRFLLTRIFWFLFWARPKKELARRRNPAPVY